MVGRGERGRRSRRIGSVHELCGSAIDGRRAGPLPLASVDVTSFSASTASRRPLAVPSAALLGLGGDETVRRVDPVVPATRRVRLVSHLVPIPPIHDRLCPSHRAEGSDPSSFTDRALPGTAAGVDDGVVVFPRAMREDAFFEMGPEALDRVELGREGRETDRFRVFEQDEVAGVVPTGPVDQQQRTGVRRHLAAELVEEGPHRRGPDDRRHEAEGGVGLGADRVEQLEYP